MRPATRGAAAPGYPLQVRPRTMPSHFGLSVSIPGRCQHVAFLLTMNTADITRFEKEQIITVEQGDIRKEVVI